MRIPLFPLFFLPFSAVSYAQNLSGRVYAEGGIPLPGVLAINISTSEKTVSDKDGIFFIPAKQGDEIRFVKQGFERKEYFVNENHQEIFIELATVVRDIEEVKVNPSKLTGNLATDSKMLSKSDKSTKLRQEIGVPAPPEKPRETPPPTLEKAGVAKYVYSNFNLNNLYKNISGDARRMRQLYKFEDAQYNIAWIKDKFSTEYFLEAGLEEGQIELFLEISAARDTEIIRYIKAENSGGVMLRLEELIKEYNSKL